MIIYNLTDKTPPWQQAERTPIKLRVCSYEIQPGDHITVKDTAVHPRDVASLIKDQLISIDVLPHWYVEEKMKGRASRRRRKQ